MENYIIYLHQNKINNKVYVGRTCHSKNPNIRWQNGFGYRHQQNFWKDIELYGWDNFNHIILEINIPTESIDTREDFWIKFFDAKNPIKGYNSRDSISVSEETKIRMKQSWKNPERK